MRPARKGPENIEAVTATTSGGDASMRPARKGPENGRPARVAWRNSAGFNEAGPQGAGKRMKTAQQAAENWRLQ